MTIMWIGKNVVAGQRIACWFMQSSRFKSQWAASALAERSRSANAAK